MIKKIFQILDKRNKFRLFFLFLFYFPLNIIETISLSSIPGFVFFIVNPEKLFVYINNESFLNILKEFSTLERVTYGSILLIILFFLRSLFILLVNSYAYFLKYKINITNSRKLYSAYLDRSYDYHIGNNASNLAQNMGDSIKSTISIIACANLFKDILLLIFLSIMIYFSSLEVFLYLMIFIFLPLVIFLIFFKNKIKKMGVIAREYRLKQHQSLIEGFSNIKFMLINKSKKIFITNYTNKNRITQKQDTKLSIINILPRIIIEFSSLLFVTGYIFFSFYRGNDIDTILPSLTLIVVAAVRIIPALSQISINLNTIKFNTNVLNRLNTEILNWEKNNLNRGNEIKKLNFIQNFQNEIEIKKISYNYQESPKKILEKISFKINKGEKIGLVGNSGSGKTTLVDIVLGLLRPTEGEILCDGIKISKDLEGWKDLITFVPQNIILLDDTIKNNISFNFDNSKFDKEKYEYALKVSGLNKILKDFSNGDETELGLFGNKISGGQKQRIGIARAVYSNKPIIILDESTNSLDKKSESEIFKNLFSSYYTLVLVSHDLYNLKKCDKIINLNEI